MEAENCTRRDADAPTGQCHQHQRASREAWAVDDDALARPVYRGEQLPVWADLSRPTLILGIATVVALFGLTLVAPGIGPRVGATMLFVWVAVLAYRLLRLDARSRAATA